MTFVINVTLWKTNCQAEILKVAAYRDLLDAQGLSKTFRATQALADVDFKLAAGEIHTLIGENGAGKSTLIKILAGVHRPDAGLLRVDGEYMSFGSPGDAMKAGIVVIPQEMQLVTTATVAENVTLGIWPSRTVLGFLPRVEKKSMHRAAAEALSLLNYNGPVDIPVSHLSFAERQLVAIARAIHRRGRILILDEPTASLEAEETEKLFTALERLKSENVGIVFVSHRLDEVVRLSDWCTTLRDGRVVDVSRKGDFDEQRLIALMTGEDGDELRTAPKADFGATALRWQDERITDGVNSEINLRTGETIGLAGLLGAGTTDLVRWIYGAGPEPAKLQIKGQSRVLKSPREAIGHGIGMVPGERRLGLIHDLSVRDNIALPHLARLCGHLWISRSRIDSLVADLIATLDIRPADPGIPVGNLSGGNQQKVIFARWLIGNIGIFLLDEPTIGIDVKAKARIHRLMRDFTAAGGSIVFASSEFHEVAAMSDTVLAMRKGRIVAALSRQSGPFGETAIRRTLSGETTR